MSDEREYHPDDATAPDSTRDSGATAQPADSETPAQGEPEAPAAPSSRPAPRPELLAPPPAHPEAPVPPWEAPPRPTSFGNPQRGPFAPPPAPQAPAAVRPRIRTNVILFLLTLASSIYWGFMQYQQFYSEELHGFFTRNPLQAPQALLGGLPFGIAVIAILLAHEMGHYLACRHYRIAASLPYFIPIPPPISWVLILMPGTMGAVIRIRGAITSRRALFDIAVAGPIAGWVAALPILAYGLSQSHVVERVEIETSGFYLTLGEPLIWPWLSGLFGPEIGPSQDLVMHPLAFVGWFALLITAMNLLPVGQLDGGHLMYTLAPKLHRSLSFGVLAFMLYAGVRYFPGWIVFAAVVSLLFMLGGMRHPRPVKYDQTLGPGRILLMVLAVAIFVTSFMLVPITLPTIGLR